MFVHPLLWLRTTHIEYGNMLNCHNVHAFMPTSATFFSYDMQHTRPINKVSNKHVFMFKVSGISMNTYCDRNCHRRQISHLTPLLDEPPRIFCIPQIESPAYILSLRVWVYLHSNFYDGLRKTFFCKSACWPFKVIQGQKL